MSASDGRASRVFISYRRTDADWPARWLADRLASEFGPGVVFQDVTSIQPGDDFAAEIEGAVGSCSVLIAVIGPRWRGGQGDGTWRLDDPQDWVRLEVLAAIRRGIRVIPVLVGGAKMPTADSLPESLRVLTRKQAVTLKPDSLDIRPLIAVLRTALSPCTPQLQRRQEANELAAPYGRRVRAISEHEFPGRPEPQIRKDRPSVSERAVDLKLAEPEDRRLLRKTAAAKHYTTGTGNLPRRLPGPTWLQVTVTAAIGLGGFLLTWTVLYSLWWCLQRGTYSAFFFNPFEYVKAVLGLAIGLGAAGLLFAFYLLPLAEERSIRVRTRQQENGL